MKTVVFSFLRGNPPTIGHELVFKRVAEVAKKNRADGFVFASHSQDPKKNPLPYKVKAEYLKKMSIPGAKFVNSNLKTPFNVAEDLINSGYEKIIMVVGEDRVKEFENRLGPWVKKQDVDFEVALSGKRNAKSKLSNASASLMRKLATDGNMDEFVSNAPSALSKGDKAQLYRQVRFHMQLKESKGTIINRAVIDGSIVEIIGQTDTTTIATVRHSGGLCEEGKLITVPNCLIEEVTFDLPVLKG